MEMPMQLLIMAMMISLSGCGMFTQYAKEDCSTLTGKDAMRCVDYRQRQANAAISQEATELLKAYRQCIHKNESDSGKVKESCGMYRDVLQTIQLGHMSCS
jgi:hypothetical protein